MMSKLSMSRPEKIVFSAYGHKIGKDFTPNMYISFEEMKVDSGVGKNFDLSTGEFKVFIEGIYEFNFHAGVCDEDTTIAIKRNGVTEFIISNKDTEAHFPIYANWLMKLEKNDRIQLKVESGHVDAENNEGEHAIRMFSGKLLV